MLQNLQPNTLKAHKREFLTVLFVRFDDAAAARTALRKIAQTLMKSARKYLEEVETFHATGTPGTSYVGVGLTAEGYDKLGIAAGQKPTDPSLRQGMQAAGLGDSAPSTRDSAFKTDIQSQSSTHGGFDNDPATMNTILSRVCGRRIDERNGGFTQPELSY
jgi:hypothetical protein